MFILTLFSKSNSHSSGRYLVNHDISLEVHFTWFFEKKKTVNESTAILTIKLCYKTENISKKKSALFLCFSPSILIFSYVSFSLLLFLAYLAAIITRHRGAAVWRFLAVRISRHLHAHLPAQLQQHQLVEITLNNLCFFYVFKMGSLGGWKFHYTQSKFLAG